MKSPLYLLLALTVLVAPLCSAFQATLYPATRQSHHVPIFMSEPSEADSSQEPVETTAAVDPNIVCPNCDMCDGSGRIAGGIGAVVPWIPIKAYRPCPNFIERGGSYQRAGQGLDEIAFGRKQD
ncbi:expressed unknown protein [Seminavis robusta]|uniref:Secreted protein n=1 Tax=Seminavis robusta TaxID=568900 RepID=A0A9N8H2C0_9STRA|nr:expressed unknown protein [Seminavis robusta]|eukprot:Sro61_g035160.1 n/a (124) ;mRNA; f:115535-116016